MNLGFYHQLPHVCKNNGKNKNFKLKKAIGRKTGLLLYLGLVA